ncbi:DUF1722 domain-containing protein [Marinobacter caseinilyticus]|uniref:DUF1722 domain-containing protein n=1 Tax=Marinobacter caseinilyticus TaxID=2692195 RepID=UPI00140B56E2|nr:DUF1722 domain-containing protein [Marinobacter caseinilyticus]
MFPNNTVFDIDAGFLDDELLAEQMRLLAGLVNARSRANNADSRVPIHWQGHEDALAMRLNHVIEEMRLRGHANPGSVPLTSEAMLWPSLDAGALQAQLACVSARAADNKRGRIRLPRNDHELWASYKYSILARNSQSYQTFGQRVAVRSVPIEQLWLSMVNASRVAPSRGGIQNALQHMWGYVSSQSTLNPQTEDLAGLAKELQALAANHQVSYLLNSTALGELRSWLKPKA